MGWYAQQGWRSMVWGNKGNSREWQVVLLTLKIRGGREAASSGEVRETRQVRFSFRIRRWKECVLKRWGG